MASTLISGNGSSEMAARRRLQNQHSVDEGGAVMVSEPADSDAAYRMAVRIERRRGHRLGVSNRKLIHREIFISAAAAHSASYGSSQDPSLNLK